MTSQQNLQEVEDGLLKTLEIAAEHMSYDEDEPAASPEMFAKMALDAADKVLSMSDGQDKTIVRRVSESLMEAFDKAVEGIGSDNGSRVSEIMTHAAFDFADKIRSIDPGRIPEIENGLTRAFNQAVDGIDGYHWEPEAPKRFAQIAFDIADRLLPEKKGPPRMTTELREAIKTMGTAPRQRERAP